MRNLKRALSLALASVMVLGMMVVGAGAAGFNDFSDKDKIENKDAVSTLVELGVINGKDDGNYDPTGIITRAEMAKLVCVVLNGGKDPNLGSAVASSYSDTTGTWAAGYIEFCTIQGIVAGDGTGKFNPTNTVTGAEAAKMLLSALGYKAEVEGYTGATWAMSVNARANTVGLYDGLTIDPGLGLNRDNAAQMVYNALNAFTVSYDSAVTVGGVTIGNSQLNVGTKTMLEDKFGVVKVEAIVTANEHAGLGTSATDEGKTKIEVAKDDAGKAIAGADGTYNVSTSLDVLGQRVTMFIKYKSGNMLDKDAVVFGTPILSSKNNVITKAGANIYTLADDNDMEYDSATTYLKNYSKVSKVDVSSKDEATKTFPVLTGGMVKVIDNNDDDVIDYVIYTEYKAGVVTSYSTKDKGSIKITSKAVGDDDDTSYSSDKANENVIGFDDVEKGDYVLAVKFGGKIYVEKPETVTGELKAFSTSKGTVKVDGTTYDISELANNTNSDLEAIDSYLKTASIIGNTATFYLDNNGCVLAVGDAEEGTSSYAVVLSKQEYKDGNSSSLGQDAKVKILMADGTVETFVVYSINGVKPGNDSYKEDGVTANCIVKYTITDDDTIKLTTDDDFQQDTANSTASFEKGKSTLTVDADTSYTVTSKTTFLYKNGDKYSVYNGKNSPSIDAKSASVNITVAANKDGEAQLVYIDSKAKGDFDGNYLYIYKTKVSETSDGYEVSAIVNGKIESVVIDTASAGKAGLNDSKMTVNVGMWAFDKDSDDVYTLDTAKSDNHKTGEVTAITKEYIRVDGKSYSLLDDTVTVVARTDKTAEEDVSASEGDTVEIIVNDDAEVIYIIITEYAE